MDSSLFDRRIKRSADRVEALQYLVESVADRSGVRALVLVDEGGRVVAGTGLPGDVVGLLRAAREVASGRATPEAIDAATDGRDVSARSFGTGRGPLVFAALSERMVGLGDAVRAAQRIVAA
jgi:hypothetical protein